MNANQIAFFNSLKLSDRVELLQDHGDYLLYIPGNHFTLDLYYYWNAFFEISFHNVTGRVVYCEMLKKIPDHVLAEIDLGFEYTIKNKKYK